MIAKTKCLALFYCLLLMLSSTTVSAGPPPWLEDWLCNIAGWSVTEIGNDLAFGEFSIESGSGIISISSGGAVTATGAIDLITGLPTSTYQVRIDSIRAGCDDNEVTISWNPAPQALTGPGTDMNLNVFVYEPTIAPAAGATLPITIPAGSGITFPITLTFYGNTVANFPQTGGNYASPNFRVRVGNRNGPNTQATATSITPLTIIETASMYFGTVAGGTATGTIIMNPTGARIPTGDGYIVATDPGIAASFQISGNPGQTYSLSYTSATLENAGGQQVTATNFTDNSIGTIPVGSIENFQVGATLNLGALQPAGNYSTTIGGGVPYSVTVNYN